MQNVAETIQFDNALRTLAAKARERYAGEQARIDRGLVIALNNGVILHKDGTASVQSASNAEIIYTVNGHCDCLDAERAPEGRCKHRWAKCLVKKACAQVAAERARDTYYATYYAPDGTWLEGTAQHHLGRGWLFVADDGNDLFYASAEALVLGGNVAIADGQLAADGNRVARIAGY